MTLFSGRGATSGCGLFLGGETRSVGKVPPGGAGSGVRRLALPHRVLELLLATGAPLRDGGADTFSEDDTLGSPGTKFAGAEADLAL